MNERSEDIAVKRPVRRVSVRLPEKDWRDLINFVVGDLHNMDEGDEVREQMERILQEIRKASA